MRVVAVIGTLVAIACARAPDSAADTAASSSDVAKTAVVPDAAPLPATALVVTERGIGPLEAGMSLGEASAAIGSTLSAPAGADSAGCYYVTWRQAPPGVRVMVEAGRIARVDVDSGSVATAAGAKVGDAEERVSQLYAGRVEVSPHKYVAGHYLTVTPENPADSAFRLVFEAAEGKIVRYRAGRRPAVEYVERCG